eukprot:CAMPEP_0206494464 /NCGR_PEP_ID=MMETSP0324_2-20121206/47741_1 /ASSEMBLY_ACC=CAM_ASM_000836 /TAXON_ID=2866 /ORGANISM="Crypthecodinium cohnii, Strain Seligo" /LENGTH=69 /DNA_ID=CAMNT_0053978119 /DNA_START=316 /DNA_END=522 /DNA_ORIENTATION=-
MIIYLHVVCVVHLTSTYPAQPKRTQICVLFSEPAAQPMQLVPELREIISVGERNLSHGQQDAVAGVAEL